MSWRVSVAVCAFGTLAVECTPKPAPPTWVEPTRPPPWDMSVRREHPHYEPEPAPRAADAQPEVPAVPTASVAPPPLPKQPIVARKPSAAALRVGPNLSKEASAAGIYALSHVPYPWPSRDWGPRKEHEPLVVNVGRPVSLPLLPVSEAEARRQVDVAYGRQVTITKAGALRMSDAEVDLSPWTHKDEQGNAVLTPPGEWLGLVHLREGSALVAYGRQGLANFREYRRRYLPWRGTQHGTTARFGARDYAHVGTMLAALMTGDIDADGTPELISYSFVEWQDEARNSLVEGEIGIVWQDPQKEPTVLSGFTNEPGGFTVPFVLPPRLSGGRPFVFSMEYCCAMTGVRWATPQPGLSVDAMSDAEDNDWQIYVEPSKTGSARLLIALGEAVDWAAPR